MRKVVAAEVWESPDDYVNSFCKKTRQGWRSTSYVHNIDILDNAEIVNYRYAKVDSSSKILINPKDLKKWFGKRAQAGKIEPKNLHKKI